MQPNRSIFLEFFSPPITEGDERSQKAKILHVILLVTAFTSLLLGFRNLSSPFLDLLLFIISALSFLGVVLNKRGHYRFTATFISVLLFALITFSLYDGVGLWDAGMLAYPIFILLTSFLFNKKIGFIAMLFSLGSASLIYYLEKAGLRDSGNFSLDDQLVVINILLVAAGVTLWAVSDSWERILANLREAYDLTLAGWAKALEIRDHETEGHSQRVSQLCVDLARKLGVAEKEIRFIHRGALLHDIGKLAVPDAILLKEDALTEAEWDVIKKHPDNAKKMLEHIPFLQSALAIPVCHHERWDGLGYPQGLAGEDIPLAARIFTVIDVWDALCSNRPYRAAWPEDEVREYLIDQSGNIFDPHVVAAFFEMLDVNEDCGSQRIMQ